MLNFKMAYGYVVAFPILVVFLDSVYSYINKEDE